MAAGLTPDLRVYTHAHELYRAAADALVRFIAATVARGARCALALAGGSTPRELYALLAHQRDVPWYAVHLFWGDERYVAPDDPRSNYRMARETLLDHIAIPAANVHPMPTGHLDPDDAAWAYEATLRRHFPEGAVRIDLVLLGLGTDGHTASLFPGSEAVRERTRLVVAGRAPVEPFQRLTLTLPVINNAALVYFLVTGSDKADTLRQVLREAPDPSVTPASAVRPDRGTVVWWVDMSAAAQLNEADGP